MKMKTDQKIEEFGHKKFRFKIDEKHAMKAIWALINLYQHKIKTPVQEIICNARDAHREVGKPDHTIDIKVTDTEFIVRDYGSGIDPDKAENIFCSIGETTKGGDNNQTGGHGVGAKSPLAYTKQFELTSYVNGKRYHYIIAKNGEMLDMNLVSTTDTNAKNGTKVVIPIKKKTSWSHYSDKDVFINSVNKCCFFWEKRPSFNYDIPDLELFRLKGLNNYAYYKKNKLFEGEHVVLDGIPYMIGNRFRNNRVLFFNTGDLRTHETRERLADNSEDKDHNDTKIKNAFAEMDQHVTTEMGNYVDTNNILESLKKLHTFNIPFKFKHDNIEFRSKSFVLNGNVTIYKSNTGSRYGSGFKYKKENFGCLEYYTEIFYNEENDSPQRVSRRVKSYLQNYVDSQQYHAVHVTNDKTIADTLKAKKLNTLSLPEINRSGDKKKDEQITITLLTKYGQDRIYRYLKDIKRKYIYVSFLENVNPAVRTFLEQKGYTVCKLSKGTIENVKNSTHFTDLLKYIENYKLSDDEVNYIYKAKLKKYDLGINLQKVSDSKISKVLEIYNLYEKETGEVDYLIPTIFYTDKINNTLLKLDAHNFEISQIREYSYEKYPLLSRHGNVETNTEYVNALYEYRK